MNENKNKYCPRCGLDFECKAGAVGSCQCATISLTEEERDYLQGKFDDCLCLNCLKEIKTEFQNQRFST